MKKLLPATTACIAFAAPAFAADLPARIYTKAPASAVPEILYNWTGFYVGGHIGGALAGPDSLEERQNGRLFGGVQLGIDRTFAGNWLMGAEVQFSGLAGNAGNGKTFPGGAMVSSKTNLLGSVTGRLGYTWGSLLLYAKGGYAVRDSADVHASVGGVPMTVTTAGPHRSGITAGGGLEYMFERNWSAKAEYQYYNFGDNHFTGGPAALVGSRFRNDEHTVKLGINYRFSQGS
ncbi:outer membrane protein [Bradyrhizobium sp.]|uniref:outer membrane protein n=1 Tax=Bradyrhizobium sp. TaxID=376 RepID=UPI001EC2EA80|nr:outer membrane beta-barrel protein [Bradyrhizobium sp.]MBV8922039.1 porin family protein [Bradyrhizobium sp.]MBV9985765.1 porin family protein [Bradyrhizobium sp.]